MSRIYVSQPYVEKRPTESVQIQCPTGSDLTVSEKEIIQQLLANKFRTCRLYSKHSDRRRHIAEVLH